MTAIMKDVAALLAVGVFTLGGLVWLDLASRLT